MSNDVEIVIRANDRTSAGFKSVTKELDDLAKRAREAGDRTDRALGAAESAAKEASVEVGQLAGEMHAAATAATELASKIDDVADAQDDLGKSGTRTDKFKSILDDIGDGADSSRSKISRLGDTIRENLGSSISRLGGIGENLGSGVIKTFESIPKSIGEAVTRGGPEILIPAAAIGAAMAATLSAAFAGAFIGGAGIGAIAIGVAGALVQVEAEVTKFKASMKSQLSDIGLPFRQPIVEALGDIDRGVKSLDLKGAFAPLASVVGPLTGDLIEMGQAAMPGIRQALEAAVPFITEVGDELPKLGAAMGDFAESMADAGPAATTLFTGLIDGASDFVSGSGEVISVLAQIYGAYQDLSGKMPYDILDPGSLALTPFKFAFDVGESVNIGSDAFKDIEKHLRALPPSADTASAAMDATASSATNLGTTASFASDAIDSLRDSMVEAAGAAMAADEAELRFQNNVDKLTESMRENGRSFNDNTEAGRANHQALIDGAQNAVSLYDAMIKAGAGTAEATAAYNAHINALVATAIAGGATKATVEALVDQYRLVPPTVSTTVTAETQAAESSIGSVTSSLAAIRDKLVTLTVRTVRQEVDIQEQQRYGSGFAAQTRAAGGPVTGIGTETSDSNLYALSRGEHVLAAAEVRAAGGHGAVMAWRRSLMARGGRPAMATPSAASAATGGGGGGATIVNNFTIHALDPRAAADAVGEALIEFTRTSGPLPARMVAST